VEELVRGFVKHWIRADMLLHGMFYSNDERKSRKKALQIDGIVYSPSSGPMILQEGNFVIVNPRFCSGVIEIKTSIPRMENFRKRLHEVHHRYLLPIGRETVQVMGIVIADPNPEKISLLKLQNGGWLNSYDYRFSQCPVFVLFKEVGGDYQPHKPAIEAMIRCVHTVLRTSINYM
jgi:hypothetical protein